MVPLHRLTTREGFFRVNRKVLITGSKGQLGRALPVILHKGKLVTKLAGRSLSDSALSEAKDLFLSLKPAKECHNALSCRRYPFLFTIRLSYCPLAMSI